MREVWRTFHPEEVNIVDRIHGKVTFYKDGTYRFESWPEHEFSYWYFHRGTLWVKHQTDAEWACCNQPNSRELNDRIAVELAIDRTLNDDAEVITWSKKPRT